MKKLMTATIVIGAVALNAPIAHADPALLRCQFNTIAQETVTGGQDTFTGVARGVIVGSAPGSSVSIRCYVRVDGVEASSTPTGTGNTAAAAAGQVTYTATDTQDVDLCAEWTDSLGSPASGTTCVDTQLIQIPPQEVIDLLDSIFQALDDILIPLEQTIVDPILCPIFIALDPVDVPGVIEFNSQGDVFLLGDPFWDCPPYDLF